MEINEQQIREWHEQGLKCAEDYKRSEFQLVEILANLSATNGHYLYKCDSLKGYAQLMWDISENIISDMVIVANKAVGVPQMLEVLKSKKTTLSKLRKICPIVSKDDYEEWIGLACECTTRIIERAVAMAQNPEKEVERKIEGALDSIFPYIPEKLAKDLERVRDLQSQSLGKSASMLEALEAMTKCYLEKHDPVVKAERTAARKTRGEERVRPIEVKTASNSADGRARLSAALTQAIDLRDRRQCTHVGPDGQRCDHRRWLHYHHVIPVALGGEDTVENLVTLCSGHHRAVHFPVSSSHEFLVEQTTPQVCPSQS